MDGRKPADGDTAGEEIYQKLAARIEDGDRYYMPRLLQRMISVETCVLNFPAKALSLRMVRPVEHIPEIGPQHIEDSLGY